MKEMEIKEVERLVIAKPVASRPTCSKFRSFSELLAGAINASPTNVCSETAITAIRPKTVRFRPVVNCAPVALVSSQAAELSGKAVDNSSVRFSKSDIKPAVIYKPQAKLVSKTTASLLANMGNYSTDQQRPVASVDACVQHSKQDKYNVSSHRASKYHQNISSDHTAEPSSLLSSQNLEEDPKALTPVASGDRASYDGYNWRKYGQKQVKGSEYPRSYYKCTHPNCPVKKKVERSFEGKIAEIVYKGEHNHSKPQPPKRTSSGTQGLGAGQDTTTPSRINHPNERNEGSECRAQSQNEIGLSTHSSYQNKAPQSHDPVGTGSVNVGARTSDNCCGLSGECDKGSKGLEGDDDDELRSKRRKCENQSNETGISGEVAGAQEACVVVQSSTDTVETFGDGFRWRKYGQKVVKGNPYPRSYYRCTGLKCNVRKHVERALDDSGVFITTYEGKHNHEMHLKSANPAASEPDSQAPTTENKP